MPKNSENGHISLKLRKYLQVTLAVNYLMCQVSIIIFTLAGEILKHHHYTTRTLTCIQLVISIACSMLIHKYSILVMKWYWTINNTSILYSCDYVTSGHAICIYCERWMLWIFICEYKTNRTDTLCTYPFFIFKYICYSIFVSITILVQHGIIYLLCD